MTTIANPGGTPVVYYGDSSATLDQITSAGSNAGNATVITRYSAHTIVVVTNGGSSNNGIRMSPNCEIGDIVEVYNLINTGNAAFIYPEAGSQFDEAGTGSSINPSRVLFRKVSATDWFTIRSA